VGHAVAGGFDAKKNPVARKAAPKIETFTTHPPPDGHEGKVGIGHWIVFYNNRRPHQALDDRVPLTAWRTVIAAKAVNMMDSASALPTYPQPPTTTKITTEDSINCNIILKDQSSCVATTGIASAWKLSPALAWIRNSY
jgi:hypothetical protein